MNNNFNLEQVNKNKENLKKFFNKIKFIKKEETYFNKKTIILFLIFYICLPVIISLALFIAKVDLKNNLPIIEVLNLIFTASAIAFLVINNFKKFYYEGFWVLVIFPLFIFIKLLISSISIEILNEEIWGRFLKNITLGNILELVFTLLSISFITFLYFAQKQNQALNDFKINFNKKNFLVFFIVIIIAFITAFLINFIFKAITNSFAAIQNESNQSELENILKNGNIFEFSTTIFSIILIAPLFEELIYRKLLAEVTNNKWWVIIISTIFFAYLHIKINNDWKNILLYFNLGIVNGCLYFYFRNLALVISTHFIWNLFALTIVFII